MALANNSSICLAQLSKLVGRNWKTNEIWKKKNLKENQMLF
jgi:hypothetical protein